MSPSALTSVQLNIDEHLTDEGIILFLENRRVGDPIPTSVIIAADPFSKEPSNSSEGLWYLYNSENTQYPNRRSTIIETNSGFWRSKDDSRIFTNTTCSGRKTTLEFYEGKVPYGKRTGWMMHEYHAEYKTLNVSNKEKDYNALCRVFVQNDQADYEEQHCSASADAGGECVERLLPIFQEPEERNLSSKDVLNRSLRHSAFSESVGVPLNGNNEKDINATCDFAIGDYLELNDLCSPETSSSSSDNSSCISINTYDFFDADALLWHIEDEGNLSEEEHIDCRFSVSTVAESSHLVIRPPSPGMANVDLFN